MGEPGTNASNSSLQWSVYNDEEEVFADVARIPRGFAAFVAAILVFYFVCGLVGNVLTIVALLRCPRVRNVTAAFIISLCVADTLFCVLVLPWEVSRFLAGKWIWGEGWICTVFPLLRYWNVATSLLSIAMITVNRYIMIAHFGVYKSVYRKRWIAVMIAFCWVFAIAMLLPTLLHKWGKFGFDAKLQTCSILATDGRSPKEVLFAVGFCVPALVIVVCYSLIFAVIHRSERRMRVHVACQISSSVALQPRMPGKADRDLRRRRNEWRITKMVLIIFVTFLLTYLPITLVKGFDPNVQKPVLHLAGYVMIYLSCCINPVIYVIMNKQYRQAYKATIFCSRPKVKIFSSSSDLNRASPGQRSKHEIQAQGRRVLLRNM